MTDERTTPGAEFADEPLDAVDTSLLAAVAELFETVDPVPSDLLERVRFSLALDEMFDEVAEITRLPADAAAVRTSLADTVRTDTLTFAAERLTAMVTVSHAGAGRVRVDGWISPPGRRRVRIRMQGAVVDLVADGDGRFVAEELREVFAQLVFYPSGEETGGLVITPLFKLTGD